MSDFRIVRKNKSYQLLNLRENKYRIVRIISEYTNEAEASQDLVALLTNCITEEELSKKNAD